MFETRTLIALLARPRTPLLLLVLLVTAGCTDNATKLSFAIKAATSTLEDSTEAETARIQYSPRILPHLPYFIVLFPDYPVDQAEVERAGLPKRLADRVFEEMAYLSVGDGRFLVVVQPGGQLAFTRHWHHFASVPEVLVVEGQGQVELLVTRDQAGVIVREASN